MTIFSTSIYNKICFQPFESEIFPKQGLMTFKSIIKIFLKNLTCEVKRWFFLLLSSRLSHWVTFDMQIFFVIPIHASKMLVLKLQFSSPFIRSLNMFISKL